MVRQEGEWGWRRAQERDVREGCAGEVIGDIRDRVGAREEVGCRMGDVNGLDWWLVYGLR